MFIVAKFYRKPEVIGLFFGEVTRDQNSECLQLPAL